MNVLKLVGMTCRGELYSSIYKSESDVPAEEMCHNSWWYLHGKLEEEMGYDKAITVNCKSAGYSVYTVDWSEISGDNVVSVFSDELRSVMHVNGIIPVEIEGIDKPCVGYFWTTDEREVEWNGKRYPWWNQRGLVCFADDDVACDYAMKKYEEKSDWI